MKTNSFIIAGILCFGLASTSCNRLKDGKYHLELLTTNDIHATWFDSSYVGGNIQKSIFAINHYVDSVRKAAGEENVLLVDGGDCLQGDNAAYYYNYVDTLSPHIFPRLVSYMKYDAIAVGNHDIETGHRVYDRVTKELAKDGIPFLAGNAIRNDNGKPYFQTYKIFKRGGLKVAVLGYTNPNIKAWLSEKLWKGMTFSSLLPLVQNDVNRVRKTERPDVVVTVMHSGVGKGDGSLLESQALDLYNSLKGVDFLVCAHDHSALILQRDSICLINSGSHSKNLGHGVIDVTVKNGKIISKTLSANLIPVKAEMADTAMRNAFRKDFEKVRKFTLRPIGELKADLLTRDAYKGMCNYMNLLHTISLSCPPAQISFAAPLTYNDKINKGTLVYNDLFKLYPFENQLFIIKMTGKEIKGCLEFAYNTQINTITSPTEHILKISNKENKRYNQVGWSFDNRPYNFDSAGGINYTVNVTAPFGKRIEIQSLANGNPFYSDSTYYVAMTSYRASGGGNILREGAGIDTDKINDRLVESYPEIRLLIYDYIKKNRIIDPEIIGNPARIGKWKFIPEDIADKALQRDMNLLFTNPK